jgi:two-component system, LytTR family, sensor kinase
MAASVPLLGYKNIRQFLIAYAAILAAGVAGFIVRLAKFDEFGWDLQVTLFFISIGLITFTWESLRAINRWLNKVYPFENNVSGRIALQLVLGGIVGLFVRLFIYWWGEPRVPFQLDKLFLATTWALYMIIPTVINLGFFTFYFIDRWKDSLTHAHQLEIEKSQVQFDNLKNQLNPHFLFNALTSLNSLIFENQQLASEFVHQLSRVYRYVLQNKDKNFVLLTTELDFIKSYVKLVETRFAGGLAINFDIQNDAREKAIVPVTLQILIENALKHNIVDKEKPLTIDIITVGDYIVVSNNMQLKTKIDTSNKQGLDNLRSLYKFLTENPVIVEQTDNRFYVKIPLITA